MTNSKFRIVYFIRRRMNNTLAKALQEGKAARAAFPHSAMKKGWTMSTAITHVTDKTFDAEVLKSANPVLVDYWAEWCGPCKMVAPVLDQAASEYAGKLTVAKLNVDDNQAIAAKFGIRGIPTLMLFKDGAVVATKVGALSKSQLNDFLETHLA